MDLLSKCGIVLSIVLSPLNSFALIKIQSEEMASYFSQNEQGIRLMHQGKYEESLDCFNSVLATNTEEHQEYIMALWGAYLCNNLLGDIESVKICKDQLSVIFNKPCQETLEFAVNHLNEHDQLHIKPIDYPVKFKNPDEKVDKEECKARINTMRNLLISFVDRELEERFDKRIVEDPHGFKTPDLRKRFRTLTTREITFLKNDFSVFINDLYMKGDRCCENCIESTLWMQCITPLLSRWNGWRAEGLPMDPR